MNASTRVTRKKGIIYQREDKIHPSNIIGKSISLQEICKAFLMET